MQGFKSVGSAQRFRSVHAAVHNTFNEFEATVARKSKVPLQRRFDVMGLMRQRIYRLACALFKRLRRNIESKVNTINKTKIVVASTSSNFRSSICLVPINQKMAISYTDDF